MLKAHQYDRIAKLAAIGPALLVQLVPWSDPNATHRGSPLARVPRRGADLYLLGGRTLPRVIGMSGRTNPEDMVLCRCTVTRLGVISGALTSMDLCEFSCRILVLTLNPLYPAKLIAGLIA